MNVLGISAFLHDSGASLVKNGRLVASANEERFTRQKHDPNFPGHAIEFCLQQSGLNPHDLDAVFFYEDPYAKFSRILSSTLWSYPFSRGAFAASMRSWIGSKLWVKNHISKHLGLHPKLIEHIPHHLSHAAHAFLTSPFDEAAILIVDSLGEWNSTSLYMARRSPKLEFKLLETFPYPHSLGLVYSAFTAFLGFSINEGECSTMALAGFGRPIFADQIRKIIRVQSDGTYTIDPSYFSFNDFSETMFTQKFFSVFGAPRKSSEPLPFDCVNDFKAGPQQQRFADIAASIQLVFEEAVLSLCRRLHTLTGSKNLCYGGGAALNCVTNTKILHNSKFEDFFIPADPGDGGASAGAALYGTHAMGMEIPFQPMTAYLGLDYDEKLDLEMLKFSKPELWTAFRDVGQQKNFRLSTEHFSNSESLIGRSTELLAQGNVLGWYQGRFEAGPRALGNRSILIDPSNKTLAQKLSTHVKLRPSFRPYGLSTTTENASLIFGSTNANIFKWMQGTTPVKAEAVSKLRAGLHVDNSTRAQVCSGTDNPLYHSLISEFSRSTGVQALLNTSFNESGFPLISSPTEALLMFVRTDMDAVALNNSIVRKIYS